MTEKTHDKIYHDALMKSVKVIRSDDYRAGFNAGMEAAAKVCADHAAAYVNNRIRHNAAVDCSKDILALREKP